MKIVAMIPYWSGYKYPKGSVQLRDTSILAGSSLINYLVRTLNGVDLIDEIVLYSSDDSILTSVSSNLKISFIKRPKKLDKQDVSIEDLIKEFLQDVEADIVVLAHPRCPYIKKESIRSCIEKVESGSHDSAFLISTFKQFAWFQGKPLNYSVDGITPNLNDIEPVSLELSSIYVFTRSMFEELGHRIGKNPHLQEVGSFEGFEVTSEEDNKIAELIINAGLSI